jgi:hypothetical protein
MSLLNPPPPRYFYPTYLRVMKKHQHSTGAWASIRARLRFLASAIPKQQYYTVSENGRRLYDLALGPLALAFVGSTDKESIATIKNLCDKYGERWVHEWLAIKGLTLSDYGVVA